MKTLAQKLALIVAEEYILHNRRTGRTTMHEDLAAFIADRLRHEVRSGVLMVGGCCDGEFAHVPEEKGFFRAYSKLDVEWGALTEAAAADVADKAVETSGYELVPLRMADRDGRPVDIKIAAEAGMSPAEAMKRLIANYRP